jgi:hypothetical protein
LDAWNQPDFDSSAWPVGKSAFGVGYDHINTPWTDTPGDIWLRKTFVLTALPAQPRLWLIHDDDEEIYINGALASMEAGAAANYREYALSPAAIAALKVGVNTIAVHCKQTYGAQVIDVGLFDKGQ